MNRFGLSNSDCIVLAIIACFVLQSVTLAQIPELKGVEGIFEAGKVDQPEVVGFPSPRQEQEDLFESQPKPKQSSKKNGSQANKVIELQKDLDAAHQLATIESRPLLAVFGADWCTWCRKLELELQDDGADSILSKWIVVKIDADRSPDLAEKMNVSALPALRVLDLQLNQIAHREGYLPVSQLETWLDEKYTAANPAIGIVLFGTSLLSSEDIEQLVGLLADRSPKIRAAAQQRLIAYPSRAAKAVLAVFKSGKLSQRLASQQILRSWKAPVDSIDPWLPGWLTQELDDRLAVWLAELPTESDSGTEIEKQPKDPIDLDHAREALESLLNSSSGSQNLSNLQLTPELVPAIRLALGAENLSDNQRQVLREALYLSLASPNTRLVQAAPLKALASLNAETHRKASEKILGQISEDDKDLGDELARDLDPIVRELTIPVLDKFHLLQDKQRVTQLLKDKSPSVRTAVLRSLSQSANGDAIDALIEYVHQESDEDLLVFAAKTLGKMKLKKARETIVHLLKHDSWRVRAATIDAIAESIEKNSGYQSKSSSGLTEELVDSILQSMNDADEFVVFRSASLVPKIIDAQSAPKFVKSLIGNPKVIDALLKDNSSYGRSETGKAVVSAALKLTSSQDVVQRSGAIQVVSKLAPTELKTKIAEIDELLDQGDAARQIALESTIRLLAGLRTVAIERSASQATQDGSTGRRMAASQRKPQIEPWHVIPEALSKTARTQNKTAPGSDDIFRENAVAKISSELDDLFGPPSISNADLSDNPFVPATSKAQAATVTDQPESASTLDDIFGTPSKADATSSPNSDKNSEKPDSKAALDELDDFFGASSVGKDKEKSGKTSPAPEEAAETNAAQPELESDSKNQGLPSAWMSKYWQLGPSVFNYKLRIGERPLLEKELRGLLRLVERIRNLQAESAATAQSIGLLDVAAIVCGNQEIVGASLDKLCQQLSNELEEKKAIKYLSLVLSWTSGQDRLNLLKRLKPDFNELSSSHRQILTQATEIDCPEITSWLVEMFDSMDQLSTTDDKFEKSVHSLRTYLQRSLFGTSFGIDHSRRYEYFSENGFGESNSQRPEGQVQALQSMERIYNSTSNPTLRAALLANLSYVDGEMAIDTAVGYLAQASTVEPHLTKLATQCALWQMDALTVDRSIQWLSHPVALVREAALVRLTTSQYDEGAFKSPFQANLIRTYSGDSEKLGISLATRSLPVEPLEQMASDRESANRFRARALLLQAKPDASPGELVDPDHELESRALLATVIAQQSSKGDLIKEFFEKSTQKFLESGDEQHSDLQIYFDALKKMRGSEFAKMRTELRKKYPQRFDE